MIARGSITAGNEIDRLAAAAAATNAAELALSTHSAVVREWRKLLAAIVYAAPLSLMVPGGQSEHKLLARSLKVPAEQLVHAVRPVADA